MSDVTQSGFGRVIEAVGWGKINFTLFVTAIELMFAGFAIVFGTWRDVVVSWSLMLFAIMLGIPIGLLLTPMDQPEKEIFSSIGTALLAFVSGWLISKVDGIAIRILDYDALTDLVVFRISACLTCFMLASTCVYVIRRYTHWELLN